MPEVLVTPAAFEEKSILRHLLELYQHDLSPFDGSDLDAFGLYDYRYLDHYWTEPGRYPFLFRVQGKLAGFALVRAKVGARQEGESTIIDSNFASPLPSQARQEGESTIIDSNFASPLPGQARQEGESGVVDSTFAAPLLAQPPTMQMAEFCVLRKYRRQGIGRQAALFLFRQFPGRWEVPELSGNHTGHAFWRSVIHEFTEGRFEEIILDNERWRGPVQVFVSGSA